jgi:hypothetical protein
MFDRKFSGAIRLILTLRLATHQPIGGEAEWSTPVSAKLLPPPIATRIPRILSRMNVFF